MKIKILIMLGAMTLASQASANWQYSKWGMTPAELIAASNGQATAASGTKSAQGSETMDATGSYTAYEYQFRSMFWFGSNGLSRVSLSLRDDQQCTELRRDLLGQYGEPVETTGTSVQRRLWSDKERSNAVALVETGLGYCELQYTPIRIDNGKL